MDWQGDVFMSWQFPVREWFVEGALAGYRVGYDQGCADGKPTLEAAKPHSLELPTDACPSGRRFHDKSMFYAKQMSDFYTKFPEDRDLPVAYLIQMLIEPKP
jgi:hypothetical protein